MSLKTKIVDIEKGRDAGKSFIVTEMPLTKADNWAMRALFALAASGVDIGGLNPSAGMLGMAQVAIKALGGIDPETGIALLDELMECVQVLPSGGNARPLIIDGDIKDLSTLFLLRKEALALHLDFLAQGDGSSLNS